MTDTEQFTTGDGCLVAYRLDGPDHLPVLVLSNSIATNHRMWDGEVAELSQTCRILRYDMRGHGGSDAPAGPYSFDRLGRDVVELLDHLHIARVHFCGLSLGGFVGQWLGVRAPDRINKLILSNTSAYLDPPAHWDDLIKSLLDKRDMSAMEGMFVRGWFPPAMLEQRPEIIEPFRSMILSTASEGLAGSFAAVRDADFRRTNALIDSPTLVIGGEDDKVTLASHSEQIARTIAGAELAILPGVHMLNVERRVDFLKLVQTFLAR